MQSYLEINYVKPKYSPQKTASMFRNVLNLRKLKIKDAKCPKLKAKKYRLL